MSAAGIYEAESAPSLPPERYAMEHPEMLKEFAASFAKPDSGILAELRNRAIRDNVPILRPDAAALLKTLAGIKRPRRILEAGTAIGYSAILLAGATEAEIETVEIDPDMAAEALKNIEAAGLTARIRVINGDAGEVLPALTRQYDMVFLDSAKGQYARLLPDIVRLLEPGGLLVADNCLFYGKILDDPETAPHKHRTIITNLREFLGEVFEGAEFSSASLVDAGDGMLIAVRK